MLRFQDLKGLLSVVRLQNMMPFLGQIDLNRLHDRFVVVTNKYFRHAAVPPCSKNSVVLSFLRSGYQVMLKINGVNY